jgi:hypothetical protein
MCISEHFAPTQTTALSAQKLPPSHQLENGLCTGNCGGWDSLIHITTPHWLDSLGFKPKWGSDFSIPMQTGHWRPTQPPVQRASGLFLVCVCARAHVLTQSICNMVSTTHTHPVPRLKKG